MFNTLYNIAGGIALAVGALGASDDFDGAQLVQNAFFGPEEEGAIILDEQEMAADEVLVAKDFNEWDEIAAKFMCLTLTGEDELSSDEKLEIAVFTGEIPSDVSDKPEEIEQIDEKSQPEGLSEEEFYSMLENLYNDAMTALASEETKAESQPLVIEAVQEDLTAVKLQPEDDANAEKAFEEVLTNSDSKVEEADDADQSKEVSEENAKELEPWILVHGLPDIPELDMNDLMDKKPAIEQPVETEQTALENVDVQEIPVVDDFITEVPEVEVPDVDVPEIEEFEAPPFGDSEAEETENADADDSEVEETENADADDSEVEEAENADADDSEVEETENADADDSKVEEAEEAENADADDSEAEEAENADADDSKAEEAEEAENADDSEADNLDIEVPELEEFGAPQFDAPKADEAKDGDLIVEPLDDEATEVESNDEALLIPSIEIPPAVVTEEQRAKISEEVDAIANQSDNFDGWIPRQIPVSGSVDDNQPQTKPEDDFIQDFSKQNAKETIQENIGIDLK